MCAWHLSYSLSACTLQLRNETWETQRGIRRHRALPTQAKQAQPSRVQARELSPCLLHLHIAPFQSAVILRRLRLECSCRHPVSSGTSSCPHTYGDTEPQYRISVWSTTVLRLSRAPVWVCVTTIALITCRGLFLRALGISSERSHGLAADPTGADRSQVDRPTCVMLPVVLHDTLVNLSFPQCNLQSAQYLDPSLALHLIIWHRMAKILRFADLSTQLDGMQPASVLDSCFVCSCLFVAEAWSLCVSL